MRTLKFFALVGIFSAFIVFQPTIAARNDQQSLTESPNFVVVGAFAYHTNAKRFAEQVQKQNLQAQYMLNPSRNLYYVYVLSTTDRDVAIDEALRLRKEPAFADTWVYNGTLGKFESREGQQTQLGGTDINPVTKNEVVRVQVADRTQHGSGSISAANESAKNVSLNTDVKVQEAAIQTTTLNSLQENPSEQITEIKSEQTSELDNGMDGANFFFKIFRTLDNESVAGDVDVIDIDRTRKMGTYKGNMPVKVSKPGSKTGTVSFVCEVFGYRKVQRDVLYSSPEGEGIEKNESGSVVVPFELVRLQKGDIAVMYNVYFFKDAAIMRPESRFEVTSLLDMLKENPNYKIKIHGHANGGAPGKIIMMANESKSFFSLTDTKDGYGSSKELSAERAEIIRDFLLSNGIATNRMEVKAWGGKRPIHDKHSTRAQENVRVEIEILEN